MPDKWEQAVGSWGRERKEMFTCTAPGGPALMEAVQPGVLSIGVHWRLQLGWGPWGCRILPVLLGDPAATPADKTWLSSISCQPPSEVKSLS